MRRSFSAFLTVALVALVSQAFAWEKEFKRGYASPESDDRARAIGELDPADEDQQDQLFKVLLQGDWYMRRVAWETLSASSGPARERLESTLRDHRKELVRDGVAMAMGASKDKSYVPNLIEALGDKSWRVRRAVCLALRSVPHKDAVAALIEHWKTEDEFQVWTHLLRTLELLTGQELGRNINKWAIWWYGHKDGFEVVDPSDDDAVADAPETGDGDDEEASAQGQHRGSVNLGWTERGVGPPLFVLPDYGYSNIYFDRYLVDLEDVVRIFYIDLPAIDQFQNPKMSPAGIPFYPVDELCEAFEEIRKAKNQEHIAILGHGISAWIAMRYAVLYPRRVSHLILVSGFTGQNAFSQGIQRLEADGQKKETRDPHGKEQKEYAWSLQIVADPQTMQPKSKYDIEAGAPMTPDKGMALERMGLTLYFADRQDTFTATLWPDIRRPMGQSIVPPFELAKEDKTPVPTLIFAGANALFTSGPDTKAIKKHYPKSKAIFLRKSRRMPFIEEHDRFSREVRGFFNKFQLRRH